MQIFPPFLRSPDEPVTGGEPAAAAADVKAAATAAAAASPAAAATEPAAAAAPSEPAAAAPEKPAGDPPWAADRDAMFADQASRDAFDTYMREKQQPYVTKLEQERKEAADKAWVFDGLNEDPDGTLQTIAEQVYGAELATRIVELLNAGATLEGAEAVATAEAAAGDKPVDDPDKVDLDKLSPEVREAVEYAREQKAKQAAAELEKQNADALAAATAQYDTWHAETMAANAHLDADDVHAYVVAADGDVSLALERLLAKHPKPADAKPAPSPTLGGAVQGGVSPSRPSGGSLFDVMGDVFDGARKAATQQ